MKWKFLFALLALPLLVSFCSRNPASRRESASRPAPRPTFAPLPLKKETPPRVETPQNPPSDGPSPYDAQVKALGEITDRYGFRRKYVVVSPGLSDAQVVELAKQLHAGEPKTLFWMLNDQTKAPQMMKALPRTALGDYKGYPLEWVEKHTAGQIMMELMPGGGKRYVVYRGAGSDVISVLD